MKVSVRISIDLDPEERFTVKHHDEPHEVRLVHRYDNDETVTLYGARVRKNGTVNANATPIMGFPIGSLPPRIADALTAVTS